nr:ATP-binding cassette domain-containing protein [Saprospiraceae bacterium]
MQNHNLLTVNDLRIRFPSENGPVQVVKGIGFSLKKGETLGIVGESGSGKSLTALSIIGLLPERAQVEAGGLFFLRKDGSETDLSQLDEAGKQALRGNEIAMIFQEPMTSLNPVMRCGEQVAEAIADFGFRISDSGAAKLGKVD